MNKSNRDIVYYYQSTDKSYHCLINDATKVVVRESIDFKTQKLYRMNERYEATDSDLIRFRVDLHKHNNEIKQFFFKRKD